MYVNCHADAAFSEQKQQRTMSIKKHSRKQRTIEALLCGIKSLEGMTNLKCSTTQ
jgi:hypothetical protein